MRTHLVLSASLSILLACGGAPGDGKGNTGSSSSSSSSGGSSSSSSGAIAPVELPAIDGATVLPDENDDPAIVEVTVSAGVYDHAFADGKVTAAWAYNGLVAGPTIQAQVGNRLIVHFTNQLAEPTTIHWHGLRVPDAMDGNPHLVAAIEPGRTFTYDFVLRDAGSYWFHPHYNTPEQIERGLMGSIVVHEAEIPRFDAERILLTDDIRLRSDGSIAPFATSGMDIMHGRGGNTLLLNGRAGSDPIAVRAGSRERWRLFNAANGRTMSLSVKGASFRVIGTDGGLLTEPYQTSRVELAIGQRFDLDVTFDGLPGSTARLVGHVLALDENDNVVEIEVPLQEFTYTTEEPTAVREVAFPAVAPLEQPLLIRPAKTLELSGYNDNGRIVFTINDYAYPDEDPWTVEREPVQVEIRNLLGMEHPFHLHGQFFKVIAPADRASGEPGLKDTVLVGGGAAVTILVYFDNPGMWMYHCHIPEHAEHGMMGHVHVH